MDTDIYKDKKRYKNEIAEAGEDEIEDHSTMTEKFIIELFDSEGNVVERTEIPLVNVPTVSQNELDQMISLIDSGYKAVEAARIITGIK